MEQPLISPKSEELGSSSQEHEQATSIQTQKRFQRSTWSSAEHQKLQDLVKEYGTATRWAWAQITAGLPGRTTKQVREHWENCARPDVKKGHWTQMEEYIISSEHVRKGSQWSLYESKLPGRTDSAIKNHWNSTYQSKANNKHFRILWCYTQQLRAGVVPAQAFERAVTSWVKHAEPEVVSKVLGSTYAAMASPLPPSHFKPPHVHTEHTAHGLHSLNALGRAAGLLGDASSNLGTGPSPSLGVRHTMTFSSSPHVPLRAPASAPLPGAGGGLVIGSADARGLLNTISLSGPMTSPAVGTFGSMRSPIVSGFTDARAQQLSSLSGISASMEKRKRPSGDTADGGTVSLDAGTSSQRVRTSDSGVMMARAASDAAAVLSAQLSDAQVAVGLGGGAAGQLGRSSRPSGNASSASESTGTLIQSGQQAVALMHATPGGMQLQRPTLGAARMHTQKEQHHKVTSFPEAVRAPPSHQSSSTKLQLQQPQQAQQQQELPLQQQQQQLQPLHQQQQQPQQQPLQLQQQQPLHHQQPLYSQQQQQYVVLTGNVAQLLQMQQQGTMAQGIQVVTPGLPAGSVQASNGGMLVNHGGSVSTMRGRPLMQDMQVHAHQMAHLPTRALISRAAVVVQDTHSRASLDGSQRPQLPGQQEQVSAGRYMRSSLDGMQVQQLGSSNTAQQQQQLPPQQGIAWHAGNQELVWVSTNSTPAAQLNASTSGQTVLIQQPGGGMQLITLPVRQEVLQPVPHQMVQVMGDGTYQLVPINSSGVGDNGLVWMQPQPQLLMQGQLPAGCDVGHPQHMQVPQTLTPLTAGRHESGHDGGIPMQSGSVQHQAQPKAEVHAHNVDAS